MEEWRLLDVEYDTPHMNLAVEESIPRMVGKGVAPNTVRFWRNPNTVVIGRFQCKNLEVNFKACQKYGTTVVRRFTGGGAVYHDYGNLNYAFTVNKNHPLIPNDIIEGYRVFSMGVVKGLKILGLNADFRPPNTIQINDKKISGMAGSLNWDVAFHHGTLLVSSNLSILSEVLNLPEEKLTAKLRSVRSVRDTVTTLRYMLGRDVTIHEVKEALIKGFENTYEIRLVKGKLTKDEEELAQELYREKYTKDEWNFGK